jgi:hypothetical protein
VMPCWWAERPIATKRTIQTRSKIGEYLRISRAGGSRTHCSRVPTHGDRRREPTTPLREPHCCRVERLVAQKTCHDASSAVQTTPRG